MKNIRGKNSLANDIEASTPKSLDDVDNSNPPSSGSFDLSTFLTIENCFNMGTVILPLAIVDLIVISISEVTTFVYVLITILLIVSAVFYVLQKRDSNFNPYLWIKARLFSG
uniref:BVpp12 protein n=1 Tax=Chelonus inanitus TaxID=49201 RepID=D7FB51_9HYME|nr:BVpp12 protein [Chelonus inanitus]